MNSDMSSVSDPPTDQKVLYPKNSKRQNKKQHITNEKITQQCNAYPMADI